LDANIINRYVLIAFHLPGVPSRGNSGGERESRVGWRRRLQFASRNGSMQKQQTNKRGFHFWRK
jgi:hypothetical protein